MDKNILLIAGSRDFNDYELLCRYMDYILQKHKIYEIISGGARGADSLRERYAKEHNIPFRLFPANWDLYGKRAGYLRNVEMGEYCKAALIFWDGESKGTQHMMNILKAENKKFITIKYNENKSNNKIDEDYDNGSYESYYDEDETSECFNDAVMGDYLGG